MNKAEDGQEFNHMNSYKLWTLKNNNSEPELDPLPPRIGFYKKFHKILCDTRIVYLRSDAVPYGNPLVRKYC